jgi:hypothetical protein
MTEAPKLFPFMVALSFGEGGPLHTNAVLAPNEAVAVVMVAIAFMQAAPTDKPLNGVSVGMLTPEFLRMALRACEGTLAPGGKNVVSLVPAGLYGPVYEPVCEHGNPLGGCPLCDHVAA